MQMPASFGRHARCGDMCKQCKEIEAKIEHYRRVAERITDQNTIAGLNNLMRDLLRKRAALHPDHSKDEPGVASASRCYALAPLVGRPFESATNAAALCGGRLISQPMPPRSRRGLGF